MGKKDANRGQKRAAQARARQRRLAQEEGRRERHARLVVERSGDPHFVQRKVRDDGTRTISWDRASESGGRVQEVLEDQLRAFREKFGREPGPDDPVFFNPDRDVPTAYGPEDLDTMFAEALGSGALVGRQRAYVEAFRELGYLVTEENAHLFSAAEIEAWGEAIDRHLDDEDEAAEFGDVHDLLAAELREVVGRTLRDRDPDAGRDYFDDLVEAVQEMPDDDTPGLPLELSLMVLLGWLAGIREAHADAWLFARVHGWVGSELGAELAARARLAGGLLGAAETPDITLEQLLDELDDDALPVLIWLVAGAVVTCGQGDPAWLEQFDINVD